jgi:acyl-CoA synthetase (AMP-forming)/AMP-acid ligase II
MLSQLIFEDALPNDRPAVVTGEGATSWTELREQAQHVFKAQTGLGRRRVGLLFRAAAETYAALAALNRLGCDVFLVDADLPVEEAVRRSGKLRLGALVIARKMGTSIEIEIHELPDEETWSGISTVTILTSGSTGEPKAARHSWESISRPVRKGPENLAPKWLLAYRPNSYAGLQVMLQCFADRGTLAIPEVHMDPQSTVVFMSTVGVQFVSATPSYWRRLIIFSDQDLLRKIPFIQLTLGGEVVDQPILDKLRGLYPQARLVHIYATTEMGRCFSVSDGLAGFPTTYLDRPHPDRAELRVHEGELLVRSQNAMHMYDPLSGQQRTGSDWFPTSDLVEIRKERVYFAGRKSDMINVAGSKVYPLEVERVIRTIPGVSDVRVFGKVSSIAGELVACEIVASGDQDPVQLKQVITETCRTQLAAPQQPRLFKFVDRLALSAAGKTLRTRRS